MPDSVGEHNGSELAGLRHETLRADFNIQGIQLSTFLNKNIVKITIVIVLYK